MYRIQTPHRNDILVWEFTFPPVVDCTPFTYKSFYDLCMNIWFCNNWLWITYGNTYVLTYVKYIQWRWNGMIFNSDNDRLTNYNEIFKILICILRSQLKWFFNWTSEQVALALHSVQQSKNYGWNLLNFQIIKTKDTWLCIDLIIYGLLWLFVWIFIVTLLPPVVTHLR